MRVQVREAAALVVERHEVRERTHHGLQRDRLAPEAAFDAEAQVGGPPGLKATADNFEDEAVAAGLESIVRATRDASDGAGHGKIGRGVKAPRGGGGCEVGEDPIGARALRREFEHPVASAFAGLGMDVLVVVERRVDDEQVQLARVRDEQVLRGDGFAAGRAQREDEGHGLPEHGRGFAAEFERDGRARGDDGDELRIGRVAEFDGALPFHAKIHVVEIGAGRQQANDYVKRQRRQRDERD